MFATLGIAAAPGGCKKDLPPEPPRTLAGEPELVTIPRPDFLRLFDKGDCDLHKIKPEGAGGGEPPTPPSEAAQKIAKYIVNSCGADAPVDRDSMDELIKTEVGKLTPEQKDKLTIILARMIDNLYRDVLEGSVNEGDALLVFYVPDAAERDSYNVRCRNMGTKEPSQRAAASLPEEVSVRIPKAAVLAAIEAAKCTGGAAPAEAADAGTAADVPAEFAQACPTLDPKLFPIANPNPTNPGSGQQGKILTVTLPSVAIAFPADDATTTTKNERDEFLRGLTIDFGGGITVNPSSIKLTAAGLEFEATIAQGAATGDRTVVVKNGEQVVSNQPFLFRVNRSATPPTDAGTHPADVSRPDAGQPEAAPPPPPPLPDNFCIEHPEACM
jgi:hypothetical protein